MSDDPTVERTSIESCRMLIEHHVRDAAETAVASAPGTSTVVADSVVFAEVIPAIEEETGIEVPMNDATARALRSLDSFAALLHRLLAAKEAGNVG